MGNNLLIGLKAVFCISACLPLLQACTGIGGVSGDMPLKVASEPTAATVYIMGKAIGETPIMIPQQQLYPAGYDADNQQLYGTLLIRKAGCRDLRKRIRYQDFDTGLSVKLDCDAAPTSLGQDRTAPTRGADSAPGSETPTQTIATPRHADMTGTDEAGRQPAEITLKQRLIRIEELKRDGLISDEEYRQVRKRILDAL